MARLPVAAAIGAAGAAEVRRLHQAATVELQRRGAAEAAAAVAVGATEAAELEFAAVCSAIRSYR